MHNLTLLTAYQHQRFDAENKTNPREFHSIPKRCISSVHGFLRDIPSLPLSFRVYAMSFSLS